MPLLTVALMLQSVAAPTLRDGLQAMQHGDLASAQSSFQALLKQEPHNAVAWAALAQVEFRLDDRKQALDAAANAERFGADAPAIQHALAMFYSGAGEPKRAAAFEQQFAASSLADADATFRAAGLYLQAGDFTRAIELGRAAVARNQTAAAHALLAQAYLASGELPSAVQEYRAAVQLSPADEESTFHLAQLLFRMDRFTESVELLESFAQKDPPSAQIELALGVAYYGLRRFPEAAAAFLKTIELAPDAEQPYLFLSRMLDQLGPALPRVQQRFEQYRTRYPQSYLGSLLLAKTLMLSGGSSDVIEPLLRETISKNGAQWEPHADLADLLSRKRDFSGAAAELERAAQLEPKEASIPFRLARIYDRLNQPEKAAAQRARHKALQENNLHGQPKSGMSAGPQ